LGARGGGVGVKALERPINHFIERLTFYREGGRLGLAWVERRADSAWLVLGRVSRRVSSVEPGAEAKLPAVYCSWLGAARTSRGEAFFAMARHPDRAAEVYVYERRGEALSGRLFLEAAQLSVAENPAGGLVAAWIRFDPASGSGRVYAGLLGDDLRTR
jgi:hypothetical protein